MWTSASWGRLPASQQQQQLQQQLPPWQLRGTCSKEGWPEEVLEAFPLSNQDSSSLHSNLILQPTKQNTLPQLLFMQTL
jgi:hypothetical protein